MRIFGIAEYPQIFPHGGATIYVGDIQSMGSRNINLLLMLPGKPG